MIAKTSVFVASFSSCLPVTCAETPATVAKRRLTPSAFPGASASAATTSLATASLPAPAVPWMTMFTASRSPSVRVW